ncbi:uncharacterized protein LOC142357643 isoform X3 [Convolutriloba macropyga]|uniref:uncharacterized protein LOC142357643 isoform X3 n=1 Tax=Convolutriloba macropyga TaxID=536237 RepID=UPI003F51F84D
MHKYEISDVENRNQDHETSKGSIENANRKVVETSFSWSPEQNEQNDEPNNYNKVSKLDNKPKNGSENQDIKTKSPEQDKNQSSSLPEKSDKASKSQPESDSKMADANVYSAPQGNKLPKLPGQTNSIRADETTAPDRKPSLPIARPAPGQYATTADNNYYGKVDNGKTGGGGNQYSGSKGKGGGGADYKDSGYGYTNSGYTKQDNDDNSDKGESSVHGTSRTKDTKNSQTITKVGKTVVINNGAITKGGSDVTGSDKDGSGQGQNGITVVGKKGESKGGWKGYYRVPRIMMLAIGGCIVILLILLIIVTIVFSLLMTNMKSDMNSIEADYEKLASRLALLEGNYSDSNFFNISDKINSVNTSLQNLTVDFRNLEYDYTNVTKPNVSQLRTDVDGLLAREIVITQTLGALSRNISSNEASITDLYEKEDVLKGRVGIAENRITLLGG